MSDERRLTREEREECYRTQKLDGDEWRSPEDEYERGFKYALAYAEQRREGEHSSEFLMKLLKKIHDELTRNGRVSNVTMARLTEEVQP